MKAKLIGGLTRVSALALCALLAVPLTGCINDDAGDVAFVKQVVPAVLGRRVNNIAELEVLTELAESAGREAVVDLLMEQPEFVDYWESVLFEKLRGLDRVGVPAEMAGCADAPLLASHVGSVAAHLVANDASVAYPGREFNLRDVLRSAVVADDLRAAVYASLLTMASAVEDQQDAANRFMEVYLDRDGACMECHNSTYSKTDEWSGWTRHAPLPWDLDGDVWGRSSAACPDHPYDGYFGYVYYLSGNGGQEYEAQCAGCHIGGGAPEHSRLLPLLSDAQIIRAVREGVGGGMPAYAAPDQGETCDGEPLCLTDADLQSLLRHVRAEFGEFVGCPDWQATYAYFEPANDCRDGELCTLRVERADSPGGCATGPLEASVSVGSVVAACENTFDVPNVVVDPPPWGMSASCGFHRSNVDLDASSAVAGALDQSALGLVAALQNGADAIAADIASGPAASVLANPPDVPASQLGSLGDQEMAFAYAVAASVVDAIGRELTGRSMRVSHGYSRNPSQRETLYLGVGEFLAGTAGIGDTWSLKRVVRAWLLSPAFNPNAPRDSTAAEPYLLLPLFDPWFDPDPRTGATVSATEGVGTNGVGEVVHRFSFNSLFLQLHHAMGWPEPSLLAQGSAYPSSDLRRAVGQPLNGNTRGFGEVTFQSLLAWEDAYGTCAKPATVRRDWIDELMATAARHGATIEDGLRAVKMRLIQEEIDLDELVAMEPLFPTHGLADAMSAVNAVDVEAGLRRFCGVIVTSPQFMLARMTEASAALPTAPALAVCPSGEACTREAVYCGFSDDLASIGVSWTPAWWSATCS